MDDLIVVKNDDLYVSTWDLAKGFKIEHKSVKRLIIKFKDEFEDVGECPIREEGLSDLKSLYPQGGRPVIPFLLNEPQATYLTTLLKNNEIVRGFKKRLTKEFFRQRRLLQKLFSRRENAEWLEKREMGKIERRIETDAIKEFIKYAKEQGATPKGADFYYANISSMENKTLFYLELIKHEYENFRDIIDGYGLDILKMADRIVAKAIKDGMEKKIYYKDIYKLAKSHVESFAKIMGKTPIEMSICSNKKLIKSTSPLDNRFSRNLLT